MPRLRIREGWRASYEFVREVYLRFSTERVPLSAGAISFFTLLSLIPLLLLGVSLTSYFLFADPAQARQIIENAAITLGPEIARALGEQVFTVVNTRGVLTGFALVLGFWTGSQVFLILEFAMNVTWRSTRRRPFWARRGLALLMVILVGTLLGVAMALTNLIRFLATLAPTRLFGFVTEISLIVKVLVSFVVPTLLIFTIFGAIYRILPTRRVTIRSIIPGALFAAVLWEGMLHLFGWYVANIANFSVLYGSLGGLVLLMLWFYYNAQILLLGAEISAVYHEHMVQAGVAEEQQVDREAGGRESW